ncbi:reverse transcriptase domain-containing protein [Paraburkholderia elongata]|uniref:reverse transcriptase domain-containing protein n=1 Tax=Paraburkholderia elongata TaxID=2675747 RepID=UPI001C13182A|nr:reverse transcriptase domain-containing protein [Paraburkholderia elongata]
MRALARKRQQQRGSAKATASRLVSTYLLDEWFVEVVRPRLRGPGNLVRFADDFVMLFAYRDDAERVLEVLGRRMGKYGLELHPNKTRMVDFRFKPKSVGDDREKALATTFNFLGFVHTWVKSRFGKPVVRQLTAKDRVARAHKAFNEQIRAMRHWRIREQHQRICRMLNGHFAYFGISGNFQRISTLKFKVELLWRKWLSRRSNASYITWKAFREILNRFPLPKARIIHPYRHKASP